MCKFKLVLITVFSAAIFSSIASPVGDKDDTDSDIEKDYEEEEHKEEDNYLKEVEDYMVNFMLFTRNNPEKFYLLQVKNKVSIKKSSFDPSKDTKIVIHGWKNSYSSNFSTTVKDAFLKRFDANVIVVDWSKQSKKNYISSRMDVSKVAGVVAQMIDLLVKKFGMDSSRVHIVGHSLGAHVAGIAGFSLTTGNVSRITGLDPAMPMFTVYESNRIRSDSADFVDIIHSCGNLLGFKTALGQVDFYPNGGTFLQPGCGFDYKGKCSHARSYLFFVETLSNPDSFMAVKCDNWDAFANRKCDPTPIPMGAFTQTTARGKYYLTTNSVAPFGRGDVVYPELPPPPPDNPDTDFFLWSPPAN